MYDRAFLLECRNSPLAKSPPVGLPPIPGVTCVAISPNLPKNGVTGVGSHHHGGHVAQQVHNTTSIAPALKSPGIMSTKSTLVISEQDSNFVRLCCKS